MVSASSPAVPLAAAAGTRAARLSWRSAAATAVVVAVARPSTWVVALAGFLAGGGVIALAWPIVVLPTPSGLQNLLGAPVSTLAFGDPSADLVRFIVAAFLGAALLVVVGLMVGAWAERRGIALVLEAAAQEGYARSADASTGAAGLMGVVLVRALALVPPVVVLALSWPTLYSVAYRELILPEDLATPLPIRIAAQVPLVLVGVFVAWLLADAAAATGVRRLVVERRSVLRAWALGWADLVRRPHRIVPFALLGVASVVVAAGPALASAALAWLRVREALEVAPDSPIGIAVATLWVGIWLGSLVLAGVGASIRSALFTMEAARPADD